MSLLVVSDSQLDKPGSRSSSSSSLGGPSRRIISSCAWSCLRKEFSCRQSPPSSHAYSRHPVTLVLLSQHRQHRIDVSIDDRGVCTVSR
jgi:hypothetical protein